MKKLALLLLCTILVWYCRPKGDAIQMSQTDSESFSIFGTWKVVDFKAGSITGMTDEKARKFIGTTIILESDSAILIHDRCVEKTVYRIRTANAEEYFYFNYKLSPRELGLTEKEIDILEIYCSIDEVSLINTEPFYELVIGKNQRLIDSCDGYFFFLSK